MNIRIFTPDDYQAIIDIHNSLHIVWPERPRTPQAWAEADQHRSPKSKHQRWVAVEDGTVVGFASYDQSPWSYPPQSFYVNVEVFPAHQRCGIGSALYDQVMEGLEVFNPPALRADAFANLPQGFSFLQTIPSPKFVSVRKTPIYGGSNLLKSPYMAVKKYRFKIGEGIDKNTVSMKPFARRLPIWMSLLSIRAHIRGWNRS